MNSYDFIGACGKFSKIFNNALAKETTEDKINKVSDSAADAVQNVVEKPSILKNCLKISRSMSSARRDR